MIEQLRQLIDTSRLDTLAADDLLSFIVDAEYDRRNKNRIERLLQQAGLKLPAACIADLQFSAKRNLRKEHLEQVMNTAFIKQQKNVLISGATGVGKTYIACAIGHIACMNGFSTKYFRVTKFLEPVLTTRS
jgi:DNA replication protein DnaC